MIGSALFVSLTDFGIGLLVAAAIFALASVVGRHFDRMDRERVREAKRDINQRRAERRGL